MLASNACGWRARRGVEVMTDTANKKIMHRSSLVFWLSWGANYWYSTRAPIFLVTRHVIFTPAPFIVPPLIPGAGVEEQALTSALAHAPLFPSRAGVAQRATLVGGQVELISCWTSAHTSW